MHKCPLERKCIYATKKPGIGKDKLVLDLPCWQFCIWKTEEVITTLLELLLIKKYKLEGKIGTINITMSCESFW